MLMFRCAQFWLILLAGLWASVSHAQITNEFTATGTYGGISIDAMDDESVALVPAAPDVRLTKTIEEVQDTNGSGVVDAGDTVVYRFEVENTGNQTLEEVTLSDPLISFVASMIGPLLPTETDTTVTATYVLTQADIDLGGFENTASAEGTLPDDINGDPQGSVTDISDAGDETTETPALDGSTDGDPTNDPTVLILDQIVELDVDKQLAEISQPFPYVFDLTYRIVVTNLGNVTATDITLTDDLASQFAPGVVLAARASAPSGALTTAELNPGFDGGATDASILIPGLAIAPAGAIGVDITVRVEVPPATFDDGVATLENTALFGLAEAGAPIGSTTDGVDGPVVTPINDADLDGIVDDEEPATGDRDGDGLTDLADYDPTGYLYCEEDGSLLTGGVITVSSLSGADDAIRIVHDGAAGFYQWYVTQAGTYEMRYTPPPDGAESVDRLPGGTLVTSGVGGDVFSLGSGEAASTGLLADFTAAANPYHLIFEIAEGDPHVINNNLPFRFCGTPALSVNKTVADGPTRLADGRSQITYEIAVESIGNSRAADIGISDPLDPVFGVGLYTVDAVTLVTAPDEFAATINPGYDGASDTALLTPGGFLDPGDTLLLELVVTVAPEESGVRTNIVTVTGADVIGGGTLGDQENSVDVLLLLNDISNDLLISKSAAPANVRTGDVVTYSIAVENNLAFGLSGLALIDQLPTGLRYRGGSARIDGAAEEPDIDGRRLTWNPFDIAAGQTRVLTLETLIGPSAGPGDITNEAWVANPATGERLTRVAGATVRIALEPVFDCTNVIGKVFDDVNLNGYQDPPPDPRAQITDQTYRGDKYEEERLEDQQQYGEPGIADVRVLTPTGTVITTDEFGRFSVPCAELPGATGTNFSLKVDERSLPEGYHVVTENPRTMRLTAGILAEMNFGAALGNVLEINLTAAAFDANGNPHGELASQLAALRNQLGDAPVLVNLSYYYREEGPATARQRLDRVAALFEATWSGTGGALEIERYVFDAR